MLSTTNNIINNGLRQVTIRRIAFALSQYFKNSKKHRAGTFLPETQLRDYLWSLSNALINTSRLDLGSNTSKLKQDQKVVELAIQALEREKTPDALEGLIMDLTHTSYEDYWAKYDEVEEIAMVADFYLTAKFQNSANDLQFIKTLKQFNKRLLKKWNSDENFRKLIRYQALLYIEDLIAKKKEELASLRNVGDDDYDLDNDFDDATSNTRLEATLEDIVADLKQLEKDLEEGNGVELSEEENTDKITVEFDNEEKEIVSTLTILESLRIIIANHSNNPL